MDTKLKSDIAESAVVTKLLKEGFNVLRPIGDRLPYDLAVEKKGKLIKLQVKSAWLQRDSFVVDNRRTKTNRRFMKRDPYKSEDFDFAVMHIHEPETFYVMPIEIFNSYKSGISLVEMDKRQRKPRSHVYREAWNLLADF